jgi:hypothetical protein
MRIYSKLLAASVLSGGIVLAGVPAHAVTLLSFASYTMKGTNTTIEWKKTATLDGKIFSTPLGGTSMGAPAVTFNFQDTTKYLDGLKAKLTLSGSETGVAAVDDVDQGGIGGSFKFLYTGPTQTFMGKTYTHNVTNLLTGTYTLAHIEGKATSGSFHDSTDIGTITYTSDIIDLSKSVARDFSFSLTAAHPAFGYTGINSMNTFNAAATGIFSAGFVPEPSTWAMLISGFGLLGLAARRRRSLSFAAV